MDTLGVPELLLILVIVLLLFGVGRIGKIGGELGKGIKAFRDGLKGDEPEQKPVEKSMVSSQPSGDHLPTGEDVRVK
jgi:sec-independent protein translocase protein TatA